jgi:hypothetical protein
MPAWLAAALIGIVGVVVAWWMDSKAAIIIGELRAIRRNLDKLRSLAEVDGDSPDSKA